MASSVIDRIQKRAFYPVKLVNGEEVHIRSLTRGQIRAVRLFANDEESVGFAIGCCLLEETGSPVFEIAEGESPKDFGKRVMEAIDLPADIHDPLIEAIMKLSQAPGEKAQDAIIKN
jgi:hypothetical protein